MLAPLSTAIVALSVGTLFLAVYYAIRERLINDGVLAILGILEVALLVQVVYGMTHLGRLAEEKATFTAYLLTLPFLPPFTALLAIKEKSRWAMVTIAVGAGAVAVMTVRLGQIWTEHGH
ncbi:conserved membrane hypothetical protein [Nostocoides japonicum T1-X7]|uniref:Integral membrane protein n=1 Tax=Nostocoides japonicum T1-X7 TaxID=1194083 RepID=A0A077LYZ9_9MICO|nr:hypothetical protein [Tetrasphaera japonica]CCH78132.1 conserved membrane hypothetical protein [Tetrasphaera japonica T1-X7]